MAFLSLGMIELVHSFNIKNEESIFKTGLLENKFLSGAFILGTALQVVVVLVKPIADIFSLVQLDFMQWLYVILISILPIVIMEFQKLINTYKFGKVIYGYQD